VGGKAAARLALTEGGPPTTISPELIEGGTTAAAGGITGAVISIVPLALPIVPSVSPLGAGATVDVGTAVAPTFAPTVAEQRDLDRS
jgi:hypothetical protein